MTVINTNIKSLIAQDTLTKNTQRLGTAMERLSTGKRINSASDDATGLAIANSGWMLRQGVSSQLLKMLMIPFLLWKLLREQCRRSHPFSKNAGVSDSVRK